jgi:hypothetical protein
MAVLALGLLGSAIGSSLIPAGLFGIAGCAAGDVHVARGTKRQPRLARRKRKALERMQARQ